MAGANAAQADWPAGYLLGRLHGGDGVWGCGRRREVPIRPDESP